MSNVIPLYGRHRAYLRAVHDGRAEMTNSREPDLFVDGLACCDQETARQLADAHLIRPVTTADADARVPAALTREGAEALTESRADRRLRGDAGSGVN
jgi:hypothetical protein